LGAGKASSFLSVKANFAVEIGDIRQKIQRRQAKKGRFYGLKPLSQEVYYLCLVNLMNFRVYTVIPGSGGLNDSFETTT